MVLKQPLLSTVANDWTALARASRKGEPLGHRPWSAVGLPATCIDWPSRLTGIAPPVDQPQGMADELR